MRFRLLSYVAAILLLAGVVGVNVTPVTYSTPNDPYYLYITEYGWPFAVRVATNVPGAQWNYNRGGVPPTLDWLAWIYNIAIGLAIPIAGLFACEFVLRRFSPKANN